MRKSKVVEESIGHKFGHLLVVELVEFRKTPSGRNVPMVRCICDCGNEHITSIWDIRAGNVKSCHKAHPRYDDRTLPAFNSIYKNSYKKRALDSGIDFEISEEEFRNLCEQPCHYCGVAPDEFSCNSGWASVSKRGKLRSGQFMSEWKYNGLDRIDSTKGYTLDNVVPCCGVCNHAKHTMSYGDFINWLDRVAITRAKQNLIYVQ